MDKLNKLDTVKIITVQNPVESRLKAIKLIKYLDALHIPYEVHDTTKSILAWSKLLALLPHHERALGVKITLPRLLVQNGTKYGGNFEEFSESVKARNLHGFLKISKKFVDQKFNDKHGNNSAINALKDYDELWEGIPRTEEEVGILRAAFARREERTAARNLEQNRPLSRSASAVRHKSQVKDVPELPPEWVKNRIDNKPGGSTVCLEKNCFFFEKLNNSV